MVYIDPQKPLKLSSKDFCNNRWQYYAYLRDHLPVHPAKIVGVNLVVAARYEDCLMITKDARFGRNRATITGGSRYPFPVPANIRLLSSSMLLEDDPEHKRLRNLVQKAFAPKSLTTLEASLTRYCHQLMDPLLEAGEVDFQAQYALPIPSRAIASMMGVDEARDMPRMRKTLRVLSDGLSGWGIIRTLFWDLHQTIKFVRELIEAKRSQPGDDILTELIQAEEQGDRLSEDELVSQVFLLIIAGYETTVHLLTNGLLALLQHPEQMAKLRANPQLMGSAVEEMLRFCGPIHGTKMNYAKQDMDMRGVHIAKGTPVMPLLGSANRDPEVFDDPDVFDIQRTPNKHLAFSQGNHFCLGAFLARMEAKVAFQVLLERTEQISLAVPADSLQIANIPGWYRHTSLPVKLR